MIGHKWEPADGTVERTQVPRAHHRSLQPGTIVRLEINPKTGEIRLHPNESQLIAGYSVSAAGLQDDFSPAGPFPSAQVNIGVPGQGGLDLAQMLGAALPGGQVHMIGGVDVTEIQRSVATGDPAARAAAKERLRELARSQGQGAGQSHSPADRLAMLQEMVDRGQLSQGEFDAKRQQILDEF